MSTESPRRLGKYELRERLGRGGMAEVWKALDTQLQRYVAIKLLHTNLQTDTNFVSRFQREAQVIAALHHPNIVQIHDFQVDQTSSDEPPIFYMVMSYIEGQTLAEYIAQTSAQGKIPSPIEVVNLFTSISLAVDYAHHKGMIHRDIKPANILLDSHNRARNPMGEPILTDFGLAKLLGVNAVTLTGTQMGTPLYTSPEQARGNPGNERSDLYSLGVILYELVTGVAPFRGDSPTAVLAQHLFASPPSPVLVNPNIPPALTMVIMTALAKDPNARFPSATMMAAAIAEALSVPVPESLHQAALSSDGRRMPSIVGIAPDEAGGSQGAMVSGSPISPLASLSASEQNLDAADMTIRVSMSGNRSTPGVPNGPTVPAPPTPALWSSNPPSWTGTEAASGGLPLSTFSSPSQISAGPGFAVPPQSTPSGPMMAIPPSGMAVNQAAPPPSAPVDPVPTMILPGRKKGWRGLYTVLLVLLLLVILGAGVGSYLTFFRNNSVTASAGGQVFFVSSGQFNPDNSAQGIADEMDFALHDLPAPQSGDSYYAWLLADRHPQAESVPLEPAPQFTLPLKIGPLPFSNGSINYFYPGTAAHDNLLSLASRLLVTEEPTSGSQQGPTANRAAWRYYAEIPQTLYGTPPLSALDHIRHLFYKETRVAVLGLPGGLDVWLFRNTEKVMEWAVSARDDYSPTLANTNVIRGLFGDILEYLDGSPNVAVDASSVSIVNPDPIASKVGLLSVSPAQQNGSDLANNPPGYLDHFALHLNGVVQAPDATEQMRLLSTQMIQGLNNAKAWLQQVRNYAKQLLPMSAAQLAQPSSLTLLDNMLQYATYAYVGQLDPKSDQVIHGVLQVHYDVQKLAALNVTANLPASL